MTTAVLCCDFQPDILGFLEPDVKTNVVEKAKQMLDTARSKNLFTIFIRVAFRPGYPEINPNNLVNYSKQYSKISYEISARSNNLQGVRRCQER
jgi:nicotinamidase-related amidase